MEAGVLDATHAGEVPVPVDPVRVPGQKLLGDRRGDRIPETPKAFREVAPPSPLLAGHGVSSRPCSRANASAHDGQ